MINSLLISVAFDSAIASAENCRPALIIPLCSFSRQSSSADGGPAYKAALELAAAVSRREQKEPAMTLAQRREAAALTLSAEWPQLERSNLSRRSGSTRLSWVTKCDVRQSSSIGSNLPACTIFSNPISR